jgi:DNA-directed RNA polymerase subunit M/transcription elongation factor TFIIS
MNKDKYCPIDEMLLRMYPSEKVGSTEVLLKCIACGYQKPMSPSTEAESLILKTVFNSGSSAAGASSGVGINEYTMIDPTLPHMKTLRCPNESCGSRADVSKQDVIYIKTDPTNMKYQYICTVCKTEWTS